ncbi:MAG TPA: peptide deformylase [Candidatus Baltobacteraceae bacterium]|jgi:peptide deformylase|nr:peptide deformylase [Candidatus Baltobacteraceae bacterium]
MILDVVQYGHPVLRQKGARIATITPEIQKLIDDMFETMRAAKGVGLAAQQIGRALQLTVIDVRGVTDRPSTFQINGTESDVAAAMPLVLINPEVKTVGDPEAGTEGCLSFPEIYGEVKRAAKANVIAMNAKGEKIEFGCGGLLARAIQHELDHLNGVLFIDRMSRAEKEELKPQLEELQARTKAALKASK